MQQQESPSESSYSSSITRIAIAQISQSVGFHGSQLSALNIFTDIATRYLQAIAKSAASSASSFNRIQCNVFDIVMALEELGSVQGFQGGGRTSVECVLDSSLVVELERFLIFTEEIPFARALGRRGGGEVCVEKDGVVGYSGKCSHVPRWLPVMPVIGVEEEGGTGKWEEEWRWRSDEDERGEVEEGVRDGMGSSVTRSGGFRKRVLCRDNWKSGSGGVEKRRMILRFKKRVSTGINVLQIMRKTIEMEE